MNKTDLKETARNLVSDSKGILAMDESFPTIKKRFEKLNIEDTEQNRQIYRDLLVTAPDLNKYISGAMRVYVKQNFASITTNSCSCAAVNVDACPAQHDIVFFLHTLCAE